MTSIKRHATTGQNDHPPTGQFDMQLISSRTVPHPGRDSLTAGSARNILFRGDNGSLVPDFSGGKRVLAERAIRLELQEALVRLNELPDDQGSS